MNSKGIFATHRLYEESTLVAKNMVVECGAGGIVAIYPFEEEKHSMLWYDAIVLTKSDCRKITFKDAEDFFTFLESVHPLDKIVPYGINCEKECCMVTKLSK